MIVIAATIGSPFLPGLLASISRAALPVGQRVVVLQGGNGYDTGKYVQALSLLGADEPCCFMQDSMDVRPDFFYLGFEKVAAKRVLAPLWSFTPEYSGGLHEWIYSRWGLADYDRGIAGPVFFAPAEFLPVMRSEITPDRFPTNKAEQEAWERGFGALAKKYGFGVDPLIPDEASWRNIERVTLATAPGRKFFPRRP